MRLSDKCLKLLRLALDSTHAGELEAAAVKFIKELKTEGVKADAFEGPAIPKGFMRVRRDSQAPPPPAGQSATSSTQTTSRQSTCPKNNPYGAYEGEQLQWVYENRHRLSKKMCAAVEEEMDARGLL